MKKLAFDIQAVARTIDEPVDRWPGNCHGIAQDMLTHKLLPGGRLIRGQWIGPIHAHSMFHGHPFSPHSWLEAADQRVVDPTRWVFENVEPYIFVGPFDDTCYDPAGNRIRAMLRHPYPVFDPAARQTKLKLSNSASLHLAQLTRIDPFVYMDTPNMQDIFTSQQICWLANLSPQELEPYTKAVYRAIKAAGHIAAIPMDNWDQVMGK